MKTIIVSLVIAWFTAAGTVSKAQAPPFIQGVVIRIPTGQSEDQHPNRRCRQRRQIRVAVERSSSDQVILTLALTLVPAVTVCPTLIPVGRASRIDPALSLGSE